MHLNLELKNEGLKNEDLQKDFKQIELDFIELRKHIYNYEKALNNVRIKCVFSDLDYYFLI